jgi:hypothetical protein
MSGRTAADAATIASPSRACSRAASSSSSAPTTSVDRCPARNTNSWSTPGLGTRNRAPCGLTEKGAHSIEAGLADWKRTHGWLAQRLDPEAARRPARAAEALEEGKAVASMASGRSPFGRAHAIARPAFLAWR